MSRNDIVLLAWGSRSMSSVRLRRMASAAARLIAVVVLPTPPFWLAIAMTMISEPTGSRRLRHCRNGLGACQEKPLHLVAQIVRIQTFEPPLQAFLVGLLGRRVERLGPIQHVLRDEDARFRPERQRQRVARSGI